MLEILEYSDNVTQYRERLSQIERRLLSVTPEIIKPITREVTRFGISYVLGIPLFTTHQLQKDFNRLSTELREVLPNQFYYENYKTHISLCVAIRNNPVESGYKLKSGDNKVRIYQDYLEVLRSLDFNQFSLRALGVYPSGTLLWDPLENENQIFDIRKQISHGLIHKKNQNPEFYFDSNQCLPDIPESVHTTIMRPYDLHELRNRFKRYNDLLCDVNREIETGRLFLEPLEISQVSFIETEVNRAEDITSLDYYTDQIIERRFCKTNLK